MNDFFFIFYNLQNDYYSVNIYCQVSLSFSQKKSTVYLLKNEEQGVHGCRARCEALEGEDSAAITSSVAFIFQYDIWHTNDHKLIRKQSHSIHKRSNIFQFLPLVFVFVSRF